MTTMNQTIDWINKIIEELVDPTIKLKDTLLKVQVLAFKIKNDKLKEWVENEINGFIDKEIPQYRRIPTAIFGNLIQNRGFGGFMTRNNSPLPVEYLDKEIREALMSVNMTSSVSEIEHMIDKGGDYQINIPHIIHNEFSKILSNGWVVDNAWQKIGLNSLEGILSSIKSNLLTFMLQLADELGENDKIDIMKETKRIDNLFDKTIGQLSGETVNITIGSDNIQTVNSGEKANFNISKGDKNEQTISPEITGDLKSFIEDLKGTIDKLGLDREEEEDIQNEIIRLETQINRSQPKHQVITEALNVIQGILVGVTANAMTPTIIERISWFIGQLKI